MPTIGAHVSDDLEAVIKSAAKASPEKKPGPWLAEAARQRLEREGMMPGNPMAELIATAQELGVEKAKQILTAAARKELAA